MAEANGGGKLEAARREMEDTLSVMGHAALWREHAEFLVALDKRHELKTVLNFVQN